MISVLILLDAPSVSALLSSLTQWWTCVTISWLAGQLRHVPGQFVLEVSCSLLYSLTFLIDFFKGDVRLEKSREYFLFTHPRGKTEMINEHTEGKK